MEYTVYILQSEKTNRFYIGFTSDIERRIKDHNRSKVYSTRKRGPWKVVYTEKFKTKKEATQREIQIKRYKGGNAFKKLVT